MGRFNLLVLLYAVIPLSHVQQGNSQNGDDVVARISGAVYDALLPVLTETKADIGALKSDISMMKTDMGKLGEKVASLMEDVADLKHETDQAIVGSTTSVCEAVNGIGKQLSIMNASMTADFGGVGAKLSRVKKKLSDKMDKLRSKLGSKFSQEYTALVQVNSTTHAGLNSLNELMTSDLNSVKTELSGVSNAICEKIEKHNAQIISELMEVSKKLSQEMTDNSSGFECGGTGGWRRAVYLDMTDPSTNCPERWQLTGYSKRTCRQVSTHLLTCDSVFFPVSGGEYSQVCGRIRGYQFGWGGGLALHSSHQRDTLDDAYFEGVAVMHGSPRKHIWTFAAGRWENYTSGGISSICPCDSGGHYYPPAPFIGDDFFCESGYVYPGYWDWDARYIFYSNDTLWDGQDCHPTSSCCSQHNPPYFTKTLNGTTTDDIELRACRYVGGVAIEQVELYVK